MTTHMPDDSAFKKQLAVRNSRSARWQMFFLAATSAGIVMLAILLMSILNQVFGLVVVYQLADPNTLVNGSPVVAASAPDLANVLKDNLTKGKMQALLLNTVIGKDVDRALLSGGAITQIPTLKVVPADLTTKGFTELTPDDLSALLAANLTSTQLEAIVLEQIVKQEVLQSWNFIDSVFNRGAVEQTVQDRIAGVGLSPTLSADQQKEAKDQWQNATIEWRSWLNIDLLEKSMSATATDAGVRGALVGSIWVLTLTMGIAAPLGIGAAIYLEEYARDSNYRSKWIQRFNTVIEINIRNLAGVPSIIYGLLGLAIFARALGFFTSGQVFTGEEATGRTILTASLTLALVILPVIIINAQEAIRAVPKSIREASYGLGATKWQTVSQQVIPAALPGILTGIILSLSRAVGETAPLIVVGAAVFLSQDPSGPFSAFTTLPIQIFNWAALPSDQFRNLSSAAIIILLIMLLALNAIAIVVRQRYSRRLQG